MSARSRTSAGAPRIVGRSVVGSVESRDGAAASGMQAGMRESYDRLAELVATLR